LNDIGRNCLVGNRKKIAKFLMRTFTCRSTFLYGVVVSCKIPILATRVRFPGGASGDIAQW
jgi:hypothetical protein